MTKRERSLDELYNDDPERADALVFGRKTGPSRRGFLSGASVAAVGAVAGSAIPFSHNIPAGFVPAAFAQATAPAAAPVPVAASALDRKRLAERACLQRLGR